MSIFHPTTVTLYQCNLLGSHCTSCFAQTNTNFNCVFCQEAPVSICVFRSNCQSVPLTTCPNPIIDTVCILYLHYIMLHSVPITQLYHNYFFILSYFLNTTYHEVGYCIIFLNNISSIYSLQKLH